MASAVEQSNYLHQLAAEAVDFHIKAEHAETTKCEYQIEAGKRLLEARAQVKAQGGKWLPWLAQYFTIDGKPVEARRAQKYMQVACAPPGAHLSFRNTLKALAQPKVAKSSKQSGDVVQFPIQPKAKLQRKPNTGAGKASKGRMKAKRKQANSAPPRRNFFAHVPLFFEEMLIAFERCATEYDLPDLDKTARALIQQRLAVEHFDEIIAYLTQLKEKVHGADSREESHGTQAD